MAGTLEYRHIGGKYLFLVQGANEFKAVERLLTTLLATLGAPGGVHQGLAPEATGYPFLHFRWDSALPDARSGRSSRVAQLVYIVAACDEGEAYDTIDGYAASFVTLLDLAGADYSPDGVIVSAERYSPWKLEEAFESP